MSGLAGVLAGHIAPGVYRWHGAFGVDEVRHTVVHAGWRFAYVDGWLSQTKTEFLTAVGAALNFPTHYGRNFDALVDCLRDLEPSPDIRQPSAEGGVVLLWDGWGTLATDDPRSFETALQVLRDRAGQDGIPFAVLLRGAGPELDEVESID